MKRFIAIITFSIVALMTYAESRNALLIANGQYHKFSRLANPVSEAKELAKSLQELGFEVNLVENASFETMIIEIKKFRDKLKTDKGIGFFHYGGHAVQVQGENYLIPVNADIPSEDYVPSRTVNVNEVMNSMLADTNIIILDSCRDNPFVGSGRSASRGLQSVKFKPKNSVIVYSAEAGKTAADGVFTPILTQKIKENQDLLYVLRDVRNEVYNRTNGRQIPGEYNQLMTAVNLCIGIPSRLAKVESEASELDRQLEALRAKQSSANSAELRRLEAESKRKQIELQQVREAEARRAAEQKRIEEENAKKNENQKKQEEEFAKMQAENAAKLREIERLKNEQSDPEEMAVLAKEINNIIAAITLNFEWAMDKAIADTKTFYQKKRDELKIDKWETDNEFADRKKKAVAELNRLENDDTAKIKSNYKKEIDGNTASLKHQLQAILDRPVIVTGRRIKVDFGEYERNEQRFPFTITDTQDPNMCYALYDMYIDVTSKDAAERNRKCQEVETAILSNGYVGFIEFAVEYDKQSDTYAADMRRMGLKKLADDSVVAVFDKDKLVKMTKYKIGDNGPGGGIVFYVSVSGFDVRDADGISRRCHVLEVSDVISSSVSWCPFNFEYYEHKENNNNAKNKNAVTHEKHCCYNGELTTQTGIGDGKHNTFRIITGKHRHGTLSQDNCAAFMCNMYASPTTKPGEWWLPSKDELNLIYQNLKLKGYISDNNWYWSSSSGLTDNAWRQSFSDGNQNSIDDKNDCYGVRAVRAFSVLPELKGAANETAVKNTRPDGKQNIKEQRELEDALKKYKIGSKGPGGGIIFYVSSDGFVVYEADGSSKKYHFLEVSKLISSSLSWCPARNRDCCYGNELSTKTGIGYGKYNTAHIVTGKHRHGKVGEDNCAAYKCSIYATPTTKAGEWWLPSKDELNLIYVNLRKKGYISDNGYFWSSSLGYDVWLQSFKDGHQNSFDKTYHNSVRAVRAF